LFHFYPRSLFITNPAYTHDVTYEGRGVSHLTGSSCVSPRVSPQSAINQTSPTITCNMQ